MVRDGFVNTHIVCPIMNALALELRFLLGKRCRVPTQNFTVTLDEHTRGIRHSFGGREEVPTNLLTIAAADSITPAWKLSNAGCVC